MVRKQKIFLLLFFIIIGKISFSQNDQEYSAQKKEGLKITEVVLTDSLPASELLSRAVNWVKVESVKFGKTDGVSVGNKAECTVSFPVKPKEINPVYDYTGKITMKVLIECKTGKYKYTIFHIKYVGKEEANSAGEIDNLVPDCGSMKLTAVGWKKLKGDAIVKANSVVAEIKEAMKILSSSKGKEDW